MPSAVIVLLCATASAQGPPTCLVAGLIHESSTFVPCPVGDVCGPSIAGQPAQYFGSRFHVNCTVQVTEVGGYLSGSESGNKKIFAAIISLAGPTALPIGNPFDPGELVATTTFDPGSPGSDVRTPLSATLAPGDYALVFGSGLFGATGEAELEVTGTPLPGNSILLWNDQGSGFAWQDLGEAGVRFVVEGLIDSENPTIICPANAVGLECPANLSVGARGSAAADDNCGSVSVSSSDVSTAGCGNTQSITRTWTATDACGLTASCDQSLSTVDTTPPTITCPANAIGLACGADTSVAARGSATAQDTCGSASVSSSDATVSGCGQTVTITRTWHATDDCGNPASCGQTIRTVDTTPPVITVNTTPITVTDTNCSGSESVTLPTATAQDGCDGSVSVTNDAPSSFPAGQTTTVTYTATDACSNTAPAELDVHVLYGAEIEVIGARHFVGSGHHPGCSKQPIVGEEFCAYDRSNGGCAKTVCGGTSFQHYDCIVATCVPANCCTTGGDGRCTMDVPPGNYLVIAQEVDNSWHPHRLAGTTTGTVHCGEHERVHVKQIVCASGRRHPCRTTRLTGSELLIAEPEFVVWDEPVQVYPFVFETIGDWGVTTTVAPPEGFVADYSALSAQVTDEQEAVQFTLTEVGSDLVPTKTTFKIRHKGQLRTVHGEAGIRLTPEYARSRGFDPDVLRAKGTLEEPRKRTPIRGAK